MKWIAKAIIQKSISFFPNKEKVNYLFQKHVTKAVRLSDEHFGWKIEHAHDHLRFIAQYAPDVKKNEARVLELGTGWYPIIPLAFHLSGFNYFTSIDIYDWMTRESFVTTVRKFNLWKETGKLADFLPQLDENRLQTLLAAIEDPQQDRDALCNRIGLTSHLIDARQTGWPENAFDFITSNNTFEHIPKAVLADILREFKRMIKPTGLMSHFIDMSDHFAHFDQSITVYNFLRYSQTAWQRIDNDIQPQNRMRWADYKKLYAELDIPFAEEAVRPGDLNALKEVTVAPEFAAYSKEELAITHGYLVSKRVV